MANLFDLIFYISLFSERIKLVKNVIDFTLEERKRVDLWNKPLNYGQRQLDVKTNYDFCEDKWRVF